MFRADGPVEVVATGGGVKQVGEAVAVEITEKAIGGGDLLWDLLAVAVVLDAVKVVASVLATAGA